MHTAQFTQSLVAFALFQANALDARENGRDAKAAMLRHAATLTDAAKVSADQQVVGAIAARFNLKATVSERPQYSGYTFDKTVKNGEAAAKALQRARAMLKPSNASEAEEAITRLTAFQANKPDAVASMMARFEKLTAGQKRSFLSRLNAR